MDQKRRMAITMLKALHRVCCLELRLRKGWIETDPVSGLGKPTAMHIRTSVSGFTVSSAGERRCGKAASLRFSRG